MLKRVLIYGSAFGSASAALLLIQYFNRLYTERSFVSALPMLGSIIITVLAVYMVIRALRRDGNLIMGKALFAGLLTSALIAGITILAYKYLLDNQPEIMNHYREGFLDVAKKAGGKEDISTKLDEYMNIRTFMSMQFQLNLSIGMLVSSAVFLLSGRRQPNA